MLHALSRTALAVLLVLTAACQPVDEGVPDVGGGRAGGTPTATPASRLAGADLDELLAGLESTALEWQDEPRVVEVVVDLDGEAWERVSVTYLAPDADRFLRVRVSEDGTAQERPTLETLETSPVPAAGLAEVPAWPDGALDPGELAAEAAAARRDCDVGALLARVVYATGAPVAWDGEAWTERPAWTAVLSDGEAAVAVDPARGTALPGDRPDACLPPG